MAIMKTESEIKIALELKVSHREAKAKLVERIDKGKEIKSNQMNSEEDLDLAEKSYSKWDDYNTQLLKNLFSTNEIANEYSRFTVLGFTSERSSPIQKKHDFYKCVEKKIHRLDSIIERIELIPEGTKVEPTLTSAVSPKAFDRNKVFVVHGQNNEAKLEVARFIEKIGFEPIILHEQVSSSKTIIEKIEAFSDVGFGVVIYTPCDIGANSSEPNNLKGRARQNVVFEHGFLIGKLGRSNVCSLVKGDMEKPNDISGIVYTSMDTSSWQIELAKELKAANYNVNMNKVLT